ncbi:hypothetical protein BDN70DRAFT_807394 [Pholiota conissans]|uniref:Protein kinase domain-containing protein n=1 Tax=Pholiota conissans TaxID=109636 RepID=A0A9P5Z3J1_9AGAR|nr:hypothetical protein BDN70DRAFT_807394 [Pholiota conissans]
MRSALTAILKISITLETNKDTTASDGVYSIDLGQGIKLSIGLVEFKQGLGEGGSDATIQAGLSMKRLWSDDAKAATVHVRSKCCCPTLMIAGGGPWLSVLGGVFTDKLIVQRLTDMMWIAQSSTYEDVRVYRFAQTMVALRECFNDLRQYYTQLYSSDIPSCLPNVPHPRFFPYPTAFERENGTITSWYYIKELHPANSEEMDPTCVTYLAQITGSQDLVVVKFVDRYGAAVHRFVANEGHAPELLYCGPLSRQTIPSPTTSFPGIALGPLQMVVMRYVKPCSLPASKPLISMREQLRSLFVKMHLSGYVFGDLRRPNVILDEKGTVQLIDFDWAGRYDRSYVDTDLNAQDIIPSNILVVSENSQDGTDYAIYPLDLSKLSFDKTGAKDLKPIRPVHDWRMLGMISLQDGL